MVKVPGAASVPRIGLRADPGLEVPEGLFESGLDDALGFLSGPLRAEAERRREEEERRKGEAKETAPERKEPSRNPLAEAFGEKPPLPRRKPEPPEAAAGRLRHGAATTARRAQAAESRLEMTRAAQAVLAAPDTPAAELPGRVKAEAARVLKEGMGRARQAGLAEEDLARLEADLGAQELLLLERGLAEQAARLQAQAEAQLEAEAGELVEALRREPGLAPSADAALAELLADFAPGFPPGALDGFGTAVRQRLAAAGVEGLLARGQPEAAEAALDEAEDLPEVTQRRLRQEIDVRRTRRPREDQALAEAIKARLLADVEAGRPVDPGPLRQIAALDGPDALEGLGEDLARAAERRRVAVRLAASPRRAWPGILQEEGFDAGSLDLVRDEPVGEQDPRLAEAPQFAQAGGDDAGEAGEEPRGPGEREISEFLAETAELDDEAFREAAAGFGLDPEIALLLRDILRVMPETEAEVRQRIGAFFPIGAGLLRNEFRTVLDQILMTEVPEERRILLEPLLKYGRAGRNLLAEAAAGSFRPGLRRPKTRRLGVTDDEDARRKRSGTSSGQRPRTRAASRLPRQAGRSSVRDFLTREDHDAYLKRLESGIPLGLTGREQVGELVATIRRGLAAAAPPGTQVRIALRGSGITGRKFDNRTGTYSGRTFDGDPADPSDYDLAIVSPQFLEKAKEAKLPLAQGGLRTRALSEDDLELLGLDQLFKNLKQFGRGLGRHGDREFSVMVYGDFKTLRERGPAMWLDR